MTFVLIALAGLLGAAGVTLAALAAHVDNSTALRAAAELAMVHAAAAIGLLAFSQHSGRAGLWRWIATAMLLGAALFSATVSLGILAEFRPLPALAPIGGTVTILSWIAVAATSILEAASSRQR